MFSYSKLVNQENARSIPAGEAVRLQRMSRGVTLRDLAQRVGVSPATISAVETGKTGMSVQRLHQIAEALDLPVADLLEMRGAKESPSVDSGPYVPRDTQDWRAFPMLPIDRVLTAAIRAFVTTGYHGASMRSIAKLAQMSVSGVYHHYESKQELLVKILDITMDDLIWRMESAREEGPDVVQRIVLSVQALALYHAKRNELAFIGASEMRSLEPENYRRIAKLRNDVQLMLDVQISAGVQEGLLSVGATSRASRAIATMCTSLPSWFNPEGPVSAEEIASEYADFALRLLGYKNLQPVAPDISSINTVV